MTGDLELAVEALVELVEDAYPALPLGQLARGLATYGHSSLTVAHYEALDAMDESFRSSTKMFPSGGNDLL